MTPAPFDYIAPKASNEAVALLERFAGEIEDAMNIAGGQSLDAHTGHVCRSIQGIDRSASRHWFFNFMRDDASIIATVRLAAEHMRIKA